MVNLHKLQKFRQFWLKGSQITSVVCQVGFAWGIQVTILERHECECEVSANSVAHFRYTFGNRFNGTTIVELLNLLPNLLQNLQILYNPVIRLQYWVEGTDIVPWWQSPWIFLWIFNCFIPCGWKFHSFGQDILLTERCT